MEFFRCPNLGHVVCCGPGDNKVMCKCGKPNPKAPASVQKAEQAQGAEVGVMHHQAAYLESATMEEMQAELEA